MLQFKERAGLTTRSFALFHVAVQGTVPYSMNDAYREVLYCRWFSYVHVYSHLHRCSFQGRICFRSYRTFSSANDNRPQLQRNTAPLAQQFRQDKFLEF